MDPKDLIFYYAMGSDNLVKGTWFKCPWYSTYLSRNDSQEFRERDHLPQ